MLDRMEALEEKEREIAKMKSEDGTVHVITVSGKTWKEIQQEAEALARGYMVELP